MVPRLRPLPADASRLEAAAPSTLPPVPCAPPTGTSEGGRDGPSGEAADFQDVAGSHLGEAPDALEFACREADEILNAVFENGGEGLFDQQEAGELAGGLTPEADGSDVRGSFSEVDFHEDEWYSECRDDSPGADLEQSVRAHSVGETDDEGGLSDALVLDDEGQARADNFVHREAISSLAAAQKRSVPLQAWEKPSFLTQVWNRKDFASINVFGAKDCLEGPVVKKPDTETRIAPGTIRYMKNEEDPCEEVFCGHA